MKSIFTILCFFCLHCIAFSQQVYEINYTLPGNISCPALLVRQPDNTGFVRLKEKNGSIHDLEWKIQRLYDQDQNKNLGLVLYAAATKDSFFYSKARSPRTITGQRNNKIESIVIWFKKNKSTGVFEPYTGALPFSTSTTGFWGDWEQVSLNNTEALQTSNRDANALTTVKKQPAKSFDKNWLKQFFSTDELSGGTVFTASQLLATRKKHKPVLYFVAVSANERLCRDDVESLAGYFEELTSFMGIGLKKIFISGTEFNVRSVTKRIQDLKPNSNDIIFFTYSGHGFSFREDEQHPFPQLALWHGDAPSKDFLRSNTINLEEIYTMIVAKKARLNIVMGDCCNSYVEMKRKHTKPVGMGVFPPISKDWDINKVSRLFLESRQSLLLAAAQKGEMAGSHDWFGGFFTYNFRDMMNNEMLLEKTGEPNWANVLVKTKTAAFETSRDYACNGSVCGQRMISKTGK